MGSIVMLLCISALGMLSGFEVLSGQKWLPRPWWLGLPEEAICLADAQNCAAYREDPSIPADVKIFAQHMKDLPPGSYRTNPTTSAYERIPHSNHPVSGRYRYNRATGQLERLPDSSVALVALRFDRAIREHNRSMLWNQIAGVAICGVSGLLAVLPLFALLLELRKFTGRLKKTRSQSVARAG